jgi:RNA polymerase-binding transcription factor DksA
MRATNQTVEPLRRAPVDSIGGAHVSQPAPTPRRSDETAEDGEQRERVHRLLEIFESAQRRVGKSFPIPNTRASGAPKACALQPFLAHFREEDSMNGVHRLLERERNMAFERLQRLGTPADFAELPAPSGATAVPDEVDQVQANERREMGLLSRQRLTTRIRRLTGAIQRIEEGAYGLCLECAGAVEPARLRAIPEVETCIRCQEALERATRGRTLRVA